MHLQMHLATGAGGGSGGESDHWQKKEKSELSGLPLGSNRKEMAMAVSV